MKRVNFALAAVGAVLLAVAGCASAPSSTDLDREAAAVMKASFRDQGIAKLDRLNQDLGQAACSSAKAEISFGTIGPSLYNYGKNRGVTDVTAPTAQPIVEYTWMKIWNGKTFNACSNMPRFGHMGLLDEKQIANVMALLLDPKSPVNQ